MQVTDRRGPFGRRHGQGQVGASPPLSIGWQDTTCGSVTVADIMWAQDLGALALNLVTKTRNGGDGGNAPTLTDLLADTSYFFAVRDQDLVTETP